MVSLTMSGWNQAYGAYDFTIPFDEKRDDYEIRFKDGIVYQQRTPFSVETHDWNQDRDSYPLLGAWFESQDGVRDFFTPEQMLQWVIEDEAIIPGLQDPLRSTKEASLIDEKRQAKLKIDESKAYLVDFKMDGKNLSIPFDRTRDDYTINMATGHTYYQTSWFEETYFLPDGTAANPPVIGAWFQDADQQSRFLTPKELVQMVADGRACVDGIDLQAQRQQEANHNCRTKDKRFIDQMSL